MMLKVIAALPLNKFATNSILICSRLPKTKDADNNAIQVNANVNNSSETVLEELKTYLVII